MSKKKNPPKTPKRGDYTTRMRSKELTRRLLREAKYLRRL